jgi:hypothetical protein
MHFRNSRNSRTHIYRPHVLCGTSTNVAAGALGFRVELVDGPEGVPAHHGQVHEVANFYVSEGGRENRKGSRIISHNQRGDNQGLRTPVPDPEKEATGVFGPLKAVLETIYTVCAQYEVRLRHSIGNFPPTDPSSGDCRR